jgi:DMSO/TMAO reductase YedYZ molybdopterin-dependent catalytic subunit
MPDSFISRAFSGRRRAPETAGRVPPGQYVTHDFPVLSAGPTPRSPLADWTFRVEGLVGEPVSWTWDEFLRLPVQSYMGDIHCVTKWSKLATHWEGVGVDRLLESVANTLAELGIRPERFGPTGATSATG